MSKFKQFPMPYQIWYETDGAYKFECYASFELAFQAAADHWSNDVRITKSVTWNMSEKESTNA